MKTPDQETLCAETRTPVRARSVLVPVNLEERRAQRNGSNALSARPSSSERHPLEQTKTARVTLREGASITLDDVLKAIRSKRRAAGLRRDDYEWGVWQRAEQRVLQAVEDAFDLKRP